MNIYPCARKPGISIECAAKLLPYISKDSTQLLHHISKSIDINAFTTRNSKTKNYINKLAKSTLETHKKQLPQIQKLVNRYRVSYNPTASKKKNPVNSLNLTKNSIDNVDDTINKRLEDSSFIKQINEHNTQEFEKLQKSISGIKNEMQLIWKKIDDNQTKVLDKLQSIEKAISNLSQARKPDTILVNIKNNDFSKNIKSAYSSYTGAVHKNIQVPKEKAFKSLNINVQNEAATSLPPIKNAASNKEHSSNPSSEAIVAADSINSRLFKINEDESVIRPDDELNKLDELIYDISHMNSKS